MSLTKVSYSMIKGAAYNVLDFGADPTGATDSTAAFQALAEATKETAGIDIYIPQGKYYVSDTISFKRMWFFGFYADGAIILPKPTANWYHKNVIEFASCSRGEIHGISMPTYIDAAAWQAVSLANRPVCGLMLRREPVGSGWTIKNLGIAGGDGCDNVKVYNTYIFGYFLKACYVNTRAETILVEGATFGGIGCSSMWDVGLPSAVYQPDNVGNSNRDKLYNFCSFQQESYVEGASFYPAVGLYDTCNDVRLKNCYWALGGMQSNVTSVAGVELGTSVGAVGAIGFSNIQIEDCYGENAGNNFVFVWMRDWDIHNIRVSGLRFSQENGVSAAAVRYSGSQQAADANLLIERVYPPDNTTPVLLIDRDINWVTVRDSRGVINSSTPGTYYVSNADIKMFATDAQNSGGSGYEVAALYPNDYQITLLQYPTMSGFNRNRPVAIGTTVLNNVSSTNCTAYFNHASSNVWDITLTGTYTTLEGFASVRPYQDLPTDYPMIGDFEVFYLNFSTNCTLKNNYNANASFYFLLKTGADTAFVAGQVAQFIRNGYKLVQV